MKDLVDIGFYHRNIGDVLRCEGEVFIRYQVLYITHLAGKQVIQANYLTLPGKQEITEMRADESSATGDQCLHRPTP